MQREIQRTRRRAPKLSSHKLKLRRFSHFYFHHTRNNPAHEPLISLVYLTTTTRPFFFVKLLYHKVQLLVNMMRENSIIIIFRPLFRKLHAGGKVQRKYGESFFWVLYYIVTRGEGECGRRRFREWKLDRNPFHAFSLIIVNKNCLFLRKGTLLRVLKINNGERCMDPDIQISSSHHPPLLSFHSLVN